jgi:hypothetical protein
MERIAALTSDLPLGAVLTPKTNTVLARTMAVVLMVQLNQTGTEIRSLLLNLLVREPLVWVEGLGGGIVCAPAEAVVLRLAVGGRLEHIVGSDDLEGSPH